VSAISADKHKVKNDRAVKDSLLVLPTKNEMTGWESQSGGL
jgi:hypothetical protein